MAARSYMRDQKKEIAGTFGDAFSAPYPLPEVSILNKIKAAYPHAHVTLNVDGDASIVQYAAAGRALAEPLPDESTLFIRSYTPPLRRLDGDDGSFSISILYCAYIIRWKKRSWLLYVATNRDGSSNYPTNRAQFLVSGPGSVTGSHGDFGATLSKTQLQAEDDALLKAVGMWRQELSEEIWVYNQGYWSKDHELYKSVAKASWDSVILDAEKKHVIQNDSARFFESREKYDSLGVPWKRGVIFYGPPGNGKTISIKALMHTLYNRKMPVLGLLVRSLASFAGPEYSLQQIFNKARQCAPCLLIFEDLDSLVTPEVRSFFLNEVDGLAANDGIYMLGSTNHLDRLDPGISKRPSRFDRKYEFPKPNTDERRQYAEFWRRKVLREKADEEDEDWEKDFRALSVSRAVGGGGDAPKIEWPRQLCVKMAEITGGFSFAYMQEAYVATLLSLAAEDEDHEQTSSEDDELEKLRLWKEFKKQVTTLRKEIPDEEL